MATNRVVKKSLIGNEDLILGKGIEVQSRDSNNYNISRIDVPFAIDSLVELTALDIAVYTRARLYSTPTAYEDYIFDPADSTGIPPDAGTGSWFKVKVITLPSLTEAKANNTFSLGSIVTTISYYSAAECTTFGITYPDGGGSIYTRVVAATGTDDGGSFLDMANGDQLQTTVSNVIDVKTFGAVGNGTTNDTTAFTNALAYATDTLVIPAGHTFFLGTELLVQKDILITGGGTVTWNALNCFNLLGTVDAEITLATAITTPAIQTITLTSNPYAAGEVLYLQSTLNAVSLDAGDAQLGGSIVGAATEFVYFGEFIEVQDVSSNDINLVRPLVFDTYPLLPDTNSGAKTISTVRKLNSIAVIVDNITFLRAADTSAAIAINYTKDTIIRNCIFKNVQYTGESVDMLNSYVSKIENCRFDLDSGFPVRFGTVNPASKNYFEFNAAKLVGCQSCSIDNNIFNNGTQNIDVTRFSEPNVNCAVTNNFISGSRLNMLTTHDGSYATSITNNIGTGCNRGISTRCPSDYIANNIILGFTGNNTTPQTTGVTNGISFGNGFHTNAVAIGNVISGFGNGIFFDDRTSSKEGFTTKKVDIRNNSFQNNDSHINITRDASNTNYITLDLSGLVISGNTFRESTTRAINIEGQYNHGIVIQDNQFIGPNGSSLYPTAFQAENCSKTIVSNNIYGDDNTKRFLSVPAITDGSVGTDSVKGSGTQTHGNTSLSGEGIDGWVYDNTLISVGGFSPFILNIDFLTLIVAQTTVVLDDIGIGRLSNTTGGTVSLSVFSGGYTGQFIQLIAAGVDQVDIVHDGVNIVTITAATIILSTTRVVGFTRVDANTWIQNY